MGKMAQRMADGVTATEILPATTDAIPSHLCHGAGNVHHTLNPWTKHKLYFTGGEDPHPEDNLTQEATS